MARPLVHGLLASASLLVACYESPTGAAPPSTVPPGEEVIDTPREAVRKIAPDHEALRWVGRWDRSDLARPRCNWTGCGVRFKTNARGIVLAVGDGTPVGVTNYDNRRNDLAVYVDGSLVTLLPSLPRNDISDVTLPGLDGEPHTVEIMKASEAMRGLIGIESLTFFDASAPVRASTRPYLEFIGDSITCGAGNLGAPGGCEAQDFEDGSQGFSAVAAAALGADRSILCISGVAAQDLTFQASIGGAGNGNSLAFGPGAAMYPEMPVVPFDDPREAKVVVVNLGTNDAAGGLDVAAYKSAMLHIIDGARKRHADARVVLVVGPMVTADQFEPIIDDIIAASSHSAALSKLVVPFDTTQRVGCTGHPNIAHARAIGEALAAHIETLPGW